MRKRRRETTGIHQVINAMAGMASHDSDGWERACGLLGVLRDALSAEEQRELHDIVFAELEPPPAKERAVTAWSNVMDLAYFWTHRHREVVETEGCPLSQELLEAMDEHENAEISLEFAELTEQLEEETNGTT